MTDHTILIDTREQAPLSFPETPTRQEGMSVGDYGVAFGDQVSPFVVERKSLKDLWHCVGTDRQRFLNQCDRLGAVQGVLVVEADYSQILTGVENSAVHPSAVIGTLIRWSARSGFSWLPIGGGGSEVASLIERILIARGRRALQDQEESSGETLKGEPDGSQP